MSEGLDKQGGGKKPPPGKEKSLFTTLTKEEHRRYSNSDDSSLSHDERDFVKEELRGSLGGFKAHSVASGSKKGNSVRSSINGLQRVEMQDLRASEEENIRSIPSKQKVTGAILNNQSAEEIKSASSFNRSEGGIQDSPHINKQVIPRVTSHFGVPPSQEEELKEQSQGAGTGYMSKFARTASLLNQNPAVTSSLSRGGGLANIIGSTVQTGAKLHQSFDLSQHRGLGAAPAQPPVPDNVTNNDDPAKRAQARLKFYRSVVQFNYYEPICLFIMTLNSIILPNYLSSVYFLFALAMILTMMTRADARIRQKFSISIFIIFFALGTFITKGVLSFLILKDRRIPELSADDIMFYKNIGIWIDKQKNEIDGYRTLLFDALEILFAMFITCIYRAQYNDVQKTQTGMDERTTSRLLNPIFDRHLDTLCYIAMFALAIETIFVQTIIQGFILILLVGKVAIWAHNLNDEKQQLRYLMLTFSQGLLALQLVVTFILQIPSIQSKVFLTDFAMIFDMFGILLHNLKLYSIILHLVAITFSISIIQFYKEARLSHIINGPFILPDEEIADKSDFTANKGKFDTKRTLKSSKVRAMTLVDLGNKYSTNTVVGRIRDKTIGAKLRLKDQAPVDESFQLVAKKYYTHFSPQIWLWLSRISIFIWAYAYHNFQSWFMLMWLMHSTLFKSTRRFIQISITYYLPIFLLIFLFYYVINIPRVVEFDSFGNQHGYDPNVDKWRTYGFYQFSIPSLEVFLMMTALGPFFILNKCRQQLEENSKEDTKQAFLQKLTEEKAPTIYYFFFVMINNLDLVAFVTIFFSGVNKIDFYHIFLMFFFVAYILWPKCFIRNYIVLLCYVDFFVFEKYLYTLIIRYIPSDSLFSKIAIVLGLATEYEDMSTNKYFKYPPKLQQWLLIIVVFLQFQVHQILKDEQRIKAYSSRARDSFKNRYPKIFHLWEIIQHLKKEFLVLMSFAVFFVLIILTVKSIINWGFQIIICVFIITYIGVGNNNPQTTGIKRLSKVWFMIIWYSSLVLILQITYQFAALPIVRQALELDVFLDMLPQWIRKNIGIIGFTSYSTYIWEKFLIYLIYFAVGVYVRKQMVIWNKEANEKSSNKAPFQDKNAINNSDMMDAYDDKPADERPEKPMNWNDEYNKIKFSTPYLVYKVKPVWIILDQFSQSLFVLISVMIMVLSNYWQISLSMAIHLTCFILLCLIIASALYKNRKLEKKKLSGKENKVRVVKMLSQDHMGRHWTEYKKTVNSLQVNLRQKIWLFQFIFTLLCMVIIYPTEFIWQFRETFIEESQPEIVKILEYFIFYMFWGGVYHSPYSVDGHGYFYNFYGYMIILILLIFEKNGQEWSLNRFGCDEEKVKHFKTIEEQLLKIKQQTLKKKNIEKPLPEHLQVIPIMEDEKENESVSDGQLSKERFPQFGNISDNLNKSAPIVDKSLAISSRKSQIDSQSSEHQSPDQELENSQGYAVTQLELKNELKKWIMKKYRIKLLNGVKILLEDSIQLMLLVSSVYKDSVIGLFLLFGVFIYMMRRKIKQMQRLAWIVGISMILQYGLAVSNLSSENNPMDFPKPFNPYPKDDKDEGQFFIPWYRKVPLLRDNFDWAMYLGMGISNTKLNGLWIDYFIMGFIQVHLMYFGCQLFNIDLKFVKGAQIDEKFKEYCQRIHGFQTPEIKRKENKKLKNEVMMYNIYKYLQTSIFMHFHQVTIVVTLLLAVLARSLFSFGYIIVCMIMIYENHKFFRPDEQNLKLQNVLKYWLQPYVFFDLTLQLMYQIPLEFLHRDQDIGIKWCWQNIIGFQDIWIKDNNQVDEMVVRNIMFIILKAFTYYFVTLQIQIFESTAYKEYKKKDFQKYKDMAETKGMAIIWRMNNLKIQKIKQQEEESNKMNDMLSNLKRILKNWQAQYNLDAASAGGSDPSVKDLQPSQQLGGPYQQLKSTHLEEKSQAQTQRDLIDDLGNSNQNPKKKKLTAITLALGSEGKKSNYAMITPMGSIHGQDKTNIDRNSLHHNASEIEEVYSLDDEELLEKAKAKLGFFASTLIFIKKEFTEQIVFINSEKFLKKVATDMESGKTNIYTKFERKMLSDIRDYKKKIQKDKENFINITDIEIKDMKRTQQLIKFGKLIQMYCQLLIEITATYSDFVCYLFMIISMMKNAGLVSLVYPFVVFGYSLMEELNPKKKIWYGILIYTEVLVLTKFIYQLSFWEALFWDYQLSGFQDILNKIHVGLSRKASGQFGEMLAYFIPEILILFAIMSHIQKEIMIGLLYLKEEHVESIRSALARYLHQNKEAILDRLWNLKEKPSKQTFKSPKKIQEPLPTVPLLGEKNEVNPPVDMIDVDNLIELFYKVDVFQVKFDKDIQKYERDNQVIRRTTSELELHNYHEAYEPLLVEPEVHLGDGDGNNKQKHHNIKAASLVDKDELNKIFEDLLERDEIQRKLSMNIVNKAEFSIKKLLYQNAYFEKLFPSFKEQKPGNDLYAIIATFQFLICVFLIFFYTKMDADVNITSDSLTYNQFSGQMVIALFLQIIVMIIDRYHYKSKTFISVQEAQQAKSKEQQMQNIQEKQQQIAEASAARFTQKSNTASIPGERGQSFIHFLRGKSEKLDDDGDSHKSEDDPHKQYYENQQMIEKQILLEKTKITIAIVSKFYLQWFLLIFVHLLVFWFFPIHGNFKLQNNANCVGGGVCNEFGGNPALIIFYILYCCYFWISALQIKYGVPEMKKGNFMMNSYTRLNKFALQGFMAVPFLFELKMFIDWTFTRTALDVFQWFILSATHAELFIARCVQGRYQRKPLGKQVPWFEKLGLGGFGQLFIVLLIAGPLLLFSNFNPISTPNPVKNSLIKLNIIVEPKDSLAKNTINLFSNNYVTQLSSITTDQYNSMQFGEDAKTKSYDFNLVQYIKMNNFSDANWAVSLPNRLQLKKEFENTSSTTNLSISLAYTFFRENPNAPQASNEVVQPLKIPGMENVLRGFTQIFSLDCEKQRNQSSFLFIPPFFTGVHYLNDKDNALADATKSLKWMKGLRVFYSCENYWIVDQYFNCTPDTKDPSVCPESNFGQQNLTGVSFYTFSTKIAPSYFKYSIITFYLSIVLVIGKLFRNVCIIPANRIFIWEIPNSEKLLLLCECIYIYRMRSQLDQEEQLYFTFADIMRSPEMIKAITGSSMKKKAD